jgi:hypothetical protein
VDAARGYETAMPLIGLSKIEESHGRQPGGRAWRHLAMRN